MTAAVTGPGTDHRPGRPHLAPVPDTEPPFDPVRGDPPPRPKRPGPRPARGSLVAAGISGGQSVTGKVSTAGRTSAAGKASSATTTTATSVLCSAVPSWSADPDMGVRRTAGAALPPARRAGQVLGTALVEVLAGRRPLGQMRVHMAPGVFAGLAGRPPRDWPAAQLSSVHICLPADGVAEVNATIRGAQRVHAIAFRIEGVDGRWRITALDIG